MEGLGLRVLHVGCGGEKLPPPLDQHEEVRLDADPAVKPDIVASMTALGDIGEFDIIYCSHALEHLYPHEVKVALSEFHRVLKVGGSAIIVVPDLEDVRPTDDVLMGTFENGITGLHMYYGDPREIPSKPFMAHHCGFIKDTMQGVLEAVFGRVIVKREPHYNLVGVGIK